MKTKSELLKTKSELLKTKLELLNTKFEETNRAIRKAKWKLIVLILVGIFDIAVLIGLIVYFWNVYN